MTKTVLFARRGAEEVTTAYTIRIQDRFSRRPEVFPAGSGVEILNRRAPGKRHLGESFLIKFSNGRTTWVRSLYILNRDDTLDVELVEED